MKIRMCSSIGENGISGHIVRFISNLFVGFNSFPDRPENKGVFMNVKGKRSPDQNVMLILRGIVWDIMIPFPSSQELSRVRKSYNANII